MPAALLVPVDERGNQGDNKQGVREADDAEQRDATFAVPSCSSRRRGRCQASGTKSAASGTTRTSQTHHGKPESFQSFSRLTSASTSWKRDHERDSRGSLPTRLELLLAQMTSGHRWIVAALIGRAWLLC